MKNKVKALLPLLLLAAALVAFNGCSKDEDSRTLDESTAVPTPVDGVATFTEHVLPLFTTGDALFKGGTKCTACHTGETGEHELGMGTYAGILLGADSVSVAAEGGTGGIDILGRADACTVSSYTPTGTECSPNWDKSKLKARLRNTRMPPGWEAALQSGRYDEGTANRSSAQINMVQSWIEVGAPESAEFDVIPWVAE